MPSEPGRRCTVAGLDIREDLDSALERGDLAATRELAGRLPTPELEDLLPRLDAPRLRTLFRALGDEKLASVIGELDPWIAARLLMRLTEDQAADVLEELPPDEAADVVGELSSDDREEVLAEMEREDAADIRELLAYPPETAGGRMTPEFIAVRETMTVDDALRHLRSPDVARDGPSYVYAVDERGRLSGVVALHELVVSRGERPISEITKRDVVNVGVADDQEHAARLLREHGFLSLPVVDEQRRLVGIVTADDMATVLEEEASEDIERLGGSQPLEEPYLDASVWHLFRKRILWLLVLFAAAAYTGNVLQAYEDELLEVVALTFFIPLLIGTGGNTGSQTVAMLVRAMALDEVRLRDIGRVVFREVTVALMLGAVMAVATYGRAWTLGVGPELGPVVAVTAICVVVWAAVVAAVLPLLLRRIGVDPAVASAPFITTLVDGTGLIIYFTLARVMLGL